MTNSADVLLDAGGLIDVALKNCQAYSVSKSIRQLHSLQEQQWHMIRNYFPVQCQQYMSHASPSSDVAQWAFMDSYNNGKDAVLRYCAAKASGFEKAAESLYTPALNVYVRRASDYDAVLGELTTSLRSDARPM